MSDFEYSEKMTGGLLFSFLLELKYNSPKSQRLIPKEERQGVKEDYSNSAFLYELTKLIGLQNINEPSTEVTSRFKTCEANGAGNGINYRKAKKAFDERIKSQYAHLHKQMANIIEEILIPDKESRLNVASLILEVLENDRSIPSNYQLYTDESGNPESKYNLLRKNDVNFPALILGLWHYTISALTDNRSGGSSFDNYFVRKGTEIGCEYELESSYATFKRPNLQLNYNPSTATDKIIVPESSDAVENKENVTTVTNPAAPAQQVNFNFTVNGDNANVRNVVNYGTYIEGGEDKTDEK